MLRFLKNSLPRSGWPNHLASIPNWAAIIFVLFLLFISTTYYWEKVSQFAEDSRDQILRSNLADKFVAELHRQIGAKGNLSRYSFDRAAKEITDFFPDVEIHLLDSQGNIALSFSRTGVSNETKQVSLEPIRTYLQNKQVPEGPIYGEDPADLKYPQVFSAASVSAAEFQGYAYIVLRNRYRRLLSIPRFEQGHLLSALLYFSVVSILLVVLAVLLQGLVRRIFSRISGVVELATSDLKVATPHTTGTPQSYEEAIVNLVQNIAADRTSLVNREENVKRLISQVSHDVRMPLMMIQFQAEQLLTESAANENNSQRRPMENIIRNVRSLASLISDMDVLELLKKAHTPLQRKSCAIDELVYDLRSIYALIAEAEGLTLSVVVPDGLPYALADVTLLERALRNLLENAIRHTRAGGKISLEVQVLSPRKLRIDLTDTGVGIPEASLPHIFEPFHQVEGADRKNGKSGLGLAIAEEVVRAHGNLLRVESKEGFGTRFWFELDVAPAD